MIYICLVSVAVDPLKGNNGVTGIRYLFMRSGDTFLHLFPLRAEAERGQMKEDGEIRSQPDATGTPVVTS